MTLISNFKRLFVSQDPSKQHDISPTNTNSSSKSTRSSRSAKSASATTPQPAFSLDPTLNETYPDLPKNFRLLTVLGEGAFSTVYRAWDSTTQEYVAIKIINKNNLSTKQLNNIKNEIAIMQKLPPHHNLLKLLHSINGPHHCFLVLEYCNGGEIFNKIIEYTYFSEQLSKHVFKQLLLAIEHLHNNNIVHRDIKPENLLFMKIPFAPRYQEDFINTLRKSDENSKADEGQFEEHVGGGTIGVIKLADFGLAKQLHSDPQFSTHSNLKTPCGTAGYTAPEVITCNTNKHSSVSKKNYYSKAVDIWSLGCLLYTINCGFPPFYDDDPEQLTRKIVTGSFQFLNPWWDEISIEAKDLISKMLTISPDDRITIDEIWQHPWVADGSKQSNYFGENSAIGHAYDVTGQDVEHIENVEPVVVSLAPLLRNEPLLSPRAEAIQRVFDSPAMIHIPTFTSDEDEAEEEEGQKNVQFIEDIIEEDAEDSFSCSSNEKFHVKRKKNKGSKCLPKTPNPTSDQLNKLNFKNVFLSNIDDDIESEMEDKITNLTSTMKSRNSSSHKSIRLDDTVEDLSSTNSLSDNDEENFEYQTRSSSIISGINGDFKFTLNLNDSSLLSRRRSSTLSRSLKNSISTSLPTAPTSPNPNESVLTSIRSAN